MIRNKAIDRLRARQRGDRLREKVTSGAGFFAERDDSWFSDGSRKNSSSKD